MTSTLAVMAGFASHRRHNRGCGLMEDGGLGTFRIARHPGRIPCAINVSMPRPEVPQSQYDRSLLPVASVIFPAPAPSE